MKKKILVLIAVVIALSAIISAVYRINTGSTDYYTQIDNSRIEKGKTRDGVIDSTGGMKYSYTLLSYDADVKEKTITFGTSRKLKQNAFICLTVVPVRGVTEWKEVKYSELPYAVQKKYSSS